MWCVFCMQHMQEEPFFNCVRALRVRCVIVPCVGLACLRGRNELPLIFAAFTQQRRRVTRTHTHSIAAIVNEHKREFTL